MSAFVTGLLILLAPQERVSPPRTADALQAVRAERWTEAAETLQTVVAINAHDGMAHYYLGRCRNALGQHGRAVAHLKRALQLGVNGGRNGMRAAHLTLARSLIALGDTDAAVHHVAEARSRWGFDGIADLLGDPDYEPLRGDARIRLLAGLEAEADAGDRNAQWRADLEHLRRLVIAAHPDPHHAIAKTDWHRAVDRIVARVPELDDRGAAAEVMRLMALVGDGHTALYPPTEGERAWHLLPFWPVRLSDGWFVVAAAPEYEELVGARLLASNGTEWEKVAAFASERTAADNEFTSRWLAGVALQFAELHAEATGQDDASTVRLTIESPGGETRDVKLPAGPIRRDPNTVWAPASWPTACSTTRATTPPWLREPETPFQLDLLAGGRAVYARLDRTRDLPGRTLTACGAAIRERWDSLQASGLVLDLRHNNGGNAYHARGFVEQLFAIPGLEEPGRLVVLIGPRSFSATGYILGMLQKHRQPLFVGWPSGCRPVQYGTERPFRLPYSGLRGSIASELRIDGYGSDDVRPAFVPDILVWPSGDDLRHGRDPVLAAALAELAGR